ncbi:MAG: hypothetical protein AAFX06_30250, partial [Planctomycetota bacterium]
MLHLIWFDRLIMRTGEGDIERVAKNPKQIVGPDPIAAVRWIRKPMRQQQHAVALRRLASLHLVGWLAGDTHGMKRS